MFPVEATSLQSPPLPPLYVPTCFVPLKLQPWPRYFPELIRPPSALQSCLLRLGLGVNSLCGGLDPSIKHVLQEYLEGTLQASLADVGQMGNTLVFKHETCGLRVQHRPFGFGPFASSQTRPPLIRRLSIDSSTTPLVSLPLIPRPPSSNRFGCSASDRAVDEMGVDGSPEILSEEPIFTHSLALEKDQAVWGAADGPIARQPEHLLPLQAADAKPVIIPQPVGAALSSSNFLFPTPRFTKDREPFSGSAVDAPRGGELDPQILTSLPWSTDPPLLPLGLPIPIIIPPSPSPPTANNVGNKPKPLRRFYGPPLVVPPYSGVDNHALPSPHSPNTQQSIWTTGPCHASANLNIHQMPSGQNQLLAPNYCSHNTLGQRYITPPLTPSPVGTRFDQVPAPPSLVNQPQGSSFAPFDGPASPSEPEFRLNNQVLLSPYLPPIGHERLQASIGNRSLHLPATPPIIRSLNLPPIEPGFLQVSSEQHLLPGPGIQGSPLPLPHPPPTRQVPFQNISAHQPSSLERALFHALAPSGPQPCDPFGPHSPSLNHLPAVQPPLDAPSRHKPRNPFLPATPRLKNADIMPLGQANYPQAHQQPVDQGFGRQVQPPLGEPKHSPFQQPANGLHGGLQLHAEDLIQFSPPLWEVDPPRDAFVAPEIIFDASVAYSEDAAPEIPNRIMDAYRVMIGNKEDSGETIKPEGSIGDGSFGRVLAVKHSRFGNVAMKALDKRKEYESEVRRQGLKSEFETFKAVSQAKNNQHLVQLLHSWQDVHFVYFVMPRYACSLTDHVYRVKGLSPNDVKFYMSQLVLALDELHSLDIVHNDIKPSNMFLKDDGTLVLGDYGLCQAGAAPPGGAFGTTGYMPPERAYWRDFEREREPPKSPNFAGDMWSVGVVLLESVHKDTSYLLSKVVRLDLLPGAVEVLIGRAKLDSMKKLLRQMLAIEPGDRISIQDLLTSTEYLGDIRTNLPQMKPDVLPIACELEPFMGPDLPSLPRMETSPDKSKRRKRALKEDAKFYDYIRQPSSHRPPLSQQ